MTVLMSAQKQAAAAAANFKLIRDHVLHQLGVPTKDAKTCTDWPACGRTSLWPVNG